MEACMRLRIIFAVFGLIVFMQGCSTVKGAQEGFKEDWKALMKVDDWMQEHLW